MIDFNHIRDFFISVAKKRGVSEKQLHRSWSINCKYRTDLNDKLLRGLTRLFGGMDLFKQGLVEKNKVILLYALAHLHGRAMDVQDFFLNFKEDIKRIGWGADWQEKSFPEGYKGPTQYDYIQPWEMQEEIIQPTEFSFHNTKFDFNQVKELFAQFASLIDYPEKLLSAWSVNCHADLNIALNYHMIGFHEAFKFFEKATFCNDELAAMWAIRACLVPRVRDITNFFIKIWEDIDRIIWDEGFNWPPIPEGYQLPESYNFKR